VLDRFRRRCAISANYLTISELQFNTMSIDAIDSGRPHCADNIQFVYLRLNLGKTRLNVADYRALNPKPLTYIHTYNSSAVVVSNWEPRVLSTNLSNVISPLNNILFNCDGVNDQQTIKKYMIGRPHAISNVSNVSLLQQVVSSFNSDGSEAASSAKNSVSNPDNHIQDILCSNLQLQIALVDSAMLILSLNAADGAPVCFVNAAGEGGEGGAGAGGVVVAIAAGGVTVEAILVFLLVLPVLLSLCDRCWN